jgi:hypothetical protein
LVAGSGRDVAKEIRQIGTWWDVGGSKVVDSRQRIRMT